MSAPNTFHLNNVYTSGSNDSLLSRCNPQRQRQPTDTSVRAHRRPDPSHLGIGSQFDNIYPSSHQQDSSRAYRSYSAWPIVLKNHAPGSAASSATPTHENDRRSDGSRLTVAVRANYVYTNPLLQLDLRSVSTSSSSRSQTQQPTAGQVGQHFYQVLRARTRYANGRQEHPSQLPRAPTSDYHRGASPTDCSQMERWRGETADQQPWNGVGVVIVSRSHRHADQRRVFHSDGSLRRSNGSSDF